MKGDTCVLLSVERVKALAPIETLVQGYIIFYLSLYENLLKLIGNNSSSH